tara:strand:+ start:326 stop:589 length:264 start_codon:yes stop_codon:yes gene_type:complete
MSTTKFKHEAGNGTLFVNSYKEKENQPDYRGTITTLDGKSLEMAGWNGKTKAGDPKISVKISEPYTKEEGKKEEESKEPKEEDTLPF